MNTIVKHWPTAVVLFLTGGLPAVGQGGFLPVALVAGICTIATAVGQYLDPPNKAAK